LPNEVAVNVAWRQQTNAVSQRALEDDRRIGPEKRPSSLFSSSSSVMGSLDPSRLIGTNPECAGLNNCRELTTRANTEVYT